MCLCAEGDGVGEREGEVASTTTFVLWMSVFIFIISLFRGVNSPASAETRADFPAPTAPMTMVREEVGHEKVI